MIKLPAIFDNYSERKDRSTLIKFETRELTDSELLEIRSLKGLEGKLIFDINDLDQDETTEVLDSIDEDLGNKSPSQRLRSVLFVYWKENKLDKSFKDFYAQQMERIILTIKNKLP